MIIFALIVTGLLAYLGFIPVLSGFLGTDQPRDLGVVHTQQDVVTATQKLGQEFVSTPESSLATTLKTAQGNPVNTALTQQEVSAHITKLHPVSNVQIKFEGSNFEMSGKIDKQRIPNFVRALGITGVSDAEILSIVDEYIPVNPVFYIAGTGNVSNGQVAVDLSKAELGRLPIPSGQAGMLLQEYVELVDQQVPGFSPTNVTLSNGMLNYTGLATQQVPVY